MHYIETTFFMNFEKLSLFVIVLWLSGIEIVFQSCEKERVIQEESDLVFLFNTRRVQLAKVFTTLCFRVYCRLELERFIRLYIRLVLEFQTATIEQEEESRKYRLFIDLERRIGTNRATIRKMPLM